MCSRASDWFHRLVPCYSTSRWSLQVAVCIESSAAAPVSVIHHPQPRSTDLPPAWLPSVDAPPLAGISYPFAGGRPPSAGARSLSSAGARSLPPADARRSISALHQRSTTCRRSTSHRPVVLSGRGARSVAGSAALAVPRHGREACRSRFLSGFRSAVEPPKKGEKRVKNWVRCFRPVRIFVFSH